MKKYDYEILNYWLDNNDLYTDYIVTDNENNKKAHSIFHIKNYDLDYMNDYELEDSLLKHLEKNEGLEFNLPKVSDLSPLFKYVYDYVCESESNMCHIDEDDWEELKEIYSFKDTDLELLKIEILDYDLDNYITVNQDGYVICGYGGLQCCFNDERSDNFER